MLLLFLRAQVIHQRRFRKKRFRFLRRPLPLLRTRVELQLRWRPSIPDQPGCSPNIRARKRRHPFITNKSSKIPRLDFPLLPRLPLPWRPARREQGHRFPYFIARGMKSQQKSQSLVNLFVRVYLFSCPSPQLRVRIFVFFLAFALGIDGR